MSERDQGFNKIISHMAEVDNAEWIRLSSMGKELTSSGFRGPSAPIIAKLREAGRIREIAIPLLSGNNFNGGESAPHHPGHRSVMFAITVHDETNKQHVLLAFPNEKNAAMTVCEIEPQTSSEGDMYDKASANERLQEEFHSLVAPSKTPFIHPSWRPQPDQTTYQSFMRQPGDVLPVKIVYGIPAETNRRFEKALAPYREEARLDALSETDIFLAADIQELATLFDNTLQQPPEKPDTNPA